MLHEKQKEIFDKLVNERALQFADIKYKIDPNKLVYQFGDQLLMYKLLGTTEKRITKEKKMVEIKHPKKNFSVFSPSEDEFKPSP